jgi:hypothetical protein
VMSKAVTAEDAADMYSTLKGVPGVSTEEYWLGNDGENSAIRSPDRDYALQTQQAPTLAMRGRFLYTEQYYAQFAHNIYDVGMPGPIASYESNSEPCMVNCSVWNGTHFTCPSPFHGDVLTCPMPKWDAGYRAPYVRVVRGGDKQAIWQRVCLEELCGRFFTGTQNLSPHYSGKGSRFYMLTQSAAYNLKAATANSSNATNVSNTSSGVVQDVSQRLQSFWTFVNASATCTSCIYGRRVCQGGSALGKECTSDQNCPLTSSTFASCGGKDRFVVKGAASWRHVHVNGRHLLFVANYWDGVTRNTTSAVYEMAENTATMFQLLQEIRTNGARAWINVTVGGKPFAIVSNSVGNSYVYPIKNSPASTPVDTSTPTALESAMGMETFLFKNEVYVALASTVGSTGRAYIYKLRLAMGDILTATLIQSISLPSSSMLTDVNYFTVQDKMYLAFASASGPSPLFHASTAATLQFTDTTRPLPTSGAVKMQYFTVAAGPTGTSHYIVAAQRTSDALLLMRWNGTRFLGPLPGTEILSGRTGGTAVSGSQLAASAAGVTYVPGKDVGTLDGVLFVALDDGLTAAAKGAWILDTLQDAVMGGSENGIMRGPTAVQVHT